MKIGKGLRRVMGMVLLASSMIGTAAAEPPALTPQQLIAQVRAQQAAAASVTPANAPQFAAVPAPPPTSPFFVPTMPARHQPTWEDKAHLEAQLAEVNSALKIHRVTERNTQEASDAIAARGQMFFTYLPGGIYEIETATFHETALELQPGERLTGKELPTAGDTARWTIAAMRTGAPPKRPRC